MARFSVIGVVLAAGVALSASCSARDEDGGSGRGGGGGGADAGGDAGTGHDGGVDAGGGGGGDAGPSGDGGPLCNEPLDVVFVIDVSTSMADEVEQIRVGMDSIWTAAQELTDNAQFGLVVFVDDVVAVNGCGPFASREAMQSEFARWREFTSTNGQPGGGGFSNSDCAENSLDALHAAASMCPWRDGATHIVIHVTDDTFAERPATLSGTGFGGGIEVQHTYAETVAALVEQEVRVGVFAAPTAEYCGAGTSGDTAQGFFEPYMGMESIPDATGGRAWSIREVRSGTLDMAAAINEFTEAEYCTLY